jgi:ferredoxin like protein
MKNLTIEDKLGKNKYNVDEHKPHIVLNKEVCKNCITKPCVKACPVGLYKLNNEEISFDYAGCLECGTCRVICPDNAIEWNYPRGTFGINYRFG